MFAAQGEARLEGASRLYLALVLLGQGELEAAEREAREAIRRTENVPPVQAHAFGVLAIVALARKRPHDALEAARTGVAALDSLGNIEEGEEMVRLVYAEALDACGDHAAAREAIARARGRLMERAATIRDPKLREGFLTHVPENARTLELARAWTT
jgi:hypothetical protein